MANFISTDLNSSRSELKKARLQIFVVAIFVLALLGAQANAFDIKDFENKIVESTLDNGLRIIVLERRDAPVASLVTYANVGSSDDPKGFTGMAHVFEHMAFKGDQVIGTNNYAKEKIAIEAEEKAFLAWRSERNKGPLADSAKLVNLEKVFRSAQEVCDQYVVTNELGNIIEREGFVNLNAFTSMDQTCYLYNFPQNKLELAIMLEAARFSNPVLREYHKEVDVVKEERRMRIESSGIGKLIEEWLSAAFKAHPYGISGVGHMSDLGNYSREEATAFFKKYYVPNNLCLIVVGDVDAKDVIKFAKKYFGDLPKGDPVELIHTVEPEQIGERRVVVEDPAQPFWLVGYHVPNSAHADKAALDALVDYLGNGRTSLLYKKLVKETKKAVNVGALTGFPGNKYPSMAAVYAINAKDVTNAEVEELVLGEIEKLKEAPLPEEELEKIRARAKANFIDQLESRVGMAIQLGSYEMIAGDWRKLFRELDRINSVTGDDIQRVAKKYFTRKNRTIAVIETTES